jgi:hypothetical protein
VAGIEGESGGVVSSYPVRTAMAWTEVWTGRRLQAALRAPADGDLHEREGNVRQRLARRRSSGAASLPGRGGVWTEARLDSHRCRGRL